MSGSDLVSSSNGKVAPILPGQNEEVLVRDERVSAIARDIRSVIQKEDAQLRAEYPWLRFQNSIAIGLTLGSLAAIIGLSWMCCRGMIAWWLAVPLIALPISILHELEHDLIHNQYFAHSRFQDVLYMIIWIVKLHGNPWYRCKLHLKHHMLSGQMSDAEERLIGLGMPLGAKRMAVSSHPMGSILRTHLVAQDASYIDENKLKKANAPMVAIFFFVTRSFILYHLAFFLAPFLGYDIENLVGLKTVYPLVKDLFICICLPGILRQASLQIMSNASHYFGDVPLNCVFYQNQILDSWWCFPFNLFCFNFGATHIVHHYLPGQPFYLRHVVARRIRSYMESRGVRRNDLGVLARGNRYIKSKEELSGSSMAYNKGIMWFMSCLLVGLPLFVVWDLWIVHQLNTNILGHIKKLLGKGKGEKALPAAAVTSARVVPVPSSNNGDLNSSSITKTVNLESLVRSLTSEDITAEQVDELSEAAAQQSTEKVQ